MILGSRALQGCVGFTVHRALGLSVWAHRALEFKYLDLGHLAGGQQKDRH